MTSMELRSHFRRLARRPQLYLAYRGLQDALRAAGVSLLFAREGFVIFVVPEGYRVEDYKEAAHELSADDRDSWVERGHRVRHAYPLSPGDRNEPPVDMFNLKDLSVLIARGIADVPEDVRFAASAALFVKTPSPHHIKAARRLSGLSAITDEAAALLSTKPQNIVLAGIHRTVFGAHEVAEIVDFEPVPSEGPTLFELPGFEDGKNLASGLLYDISRWRCGQLAWSEVSRGALVSRPAGCGKTFFAAALARALDFRLLTTTLGGWQARGSLGDILAAMRASFEEARKNRGAVLFIDEIDALGARVTAPVGRYGDHYWHVSGSEFLALTSGDNEGVVIVGATNFPDGIDQAVLRAGRLERHFAIEVPDAAARTEILAFHIRGALPIESLHEIASFLEGKSAAALEELVRLARKRARDEERKIDITDLRMQLPQRCRYSTEQQFRLAVHEAGHALVSLAVGHSLRATIEVSETFDPSSEKRLGGMTCYELVEDRITTESSLRNRVAVALAGMAAEDVVFSDRSIGSGGAIGSDVERATSLARRMVASHGFGRAPVFLGAVEVVGGNRLPHNLEQEALEILSAQYLRVLAMLTVGRERLI